jgi:hypothetical protein
MDTSEARDHLEMVERIVAASSRKLEAGGEYFVVWGILSGTFDLGVQLINDGKLPIAAIWLAPVLLLAGALFSVLRGRSFRRRGCGLSLLQREFFNVLWLTLAMALVVDVVGSHIFTGWALSAIWNVAGTTVLFYIGMHGNRRATIGGIVMILSIACANFMLPYAGYALAAGMCLGYAGFGVADLLANE